MKILIGLSGGVDSSVAAALLVAQGHEVIGAHLRFWHEDSVPPNSAQKMPQNKCCDITATQTALQVAKKLNIPFHILNARNAFYRAVVQPFLAAYQVGDTPNPCIACNRQIKFGFFLDTMRELGCDAVATGHYVRNEYNAATEEYELSMGVDSEKDQSYFLYHLSQEKLAHIVFPLGHMTKPEVRVEAGRMGLFAVQRSKESQGVCFFPEETPAGFLRRNLPPGQVRAGPIVTTTGKQIGTHAGLPLYTRGQRRGVGAGGLPVPHFVVGTDVARNALIIGTEDALRATRVTARDPVWVSGVAPAVGDMVQVRIRYRMAPVAATIREIAEDSVVVDCHMPVRAVTSGQAMVLYDSMRVLGGATICAS